MRENNRNPEAPNGRIDLNTDLLTVGVLDSLSFIDLIGFIESKTGRRIELADIEPEEFTTVKGLCHYTFSKRLIA